MQTSLAVLLYLALLVTCANWITASLSSYVQADGESAIAAAGDVAPDDGKAPTMQARNQGNRDRGRIQHTYTRNKYN